MSKAKKVFSPEGKIYYAYAPPCPNEPEHTEAPTGYVEWHDWAEEMSKTHKQTQCPTCQLWVVWIPNDRHS